MQTQPALELVTEDLFRQLPDDGVIYAEFRFAPLLHTEGGLTPGREFFQFHLQLGAPGGARTPDLMIRSHSLYPAELQAHTIGSITASAL